ncbi:hypothetical protein [Haliea sp.]|uniref:hypothetical protein n=1 Tax=Haliea sp. TaxID=1932666 RepID=UPI0035291585
MMTICFNALQKFIFTVFKYFFSTTRLTTLSVVLVTSGCAPLAEIQETQKYPRDTALTIGGYSYLINTYRCAEVRSINDEGVLECYAGDGSLSAQVTPASQFQLNMFEKYVDYEWGSEEHQAFLYDFHYLGGKERLANGIVQPFFTVFEVTKQVMDATKYSSESSATTGPIYGKDPVLEGMSAWEARQFSLASWHFSNSNYFSFGNGLTYDTGGSLSKKIGGITHHSNGLKSYHFGDSTYHSNRTTSVRIGDNMSYTSDGTICTSLTSNITRCRKN